MVAGIMTFGHEAQVMFACLSDEQQNAAYLELAERIADRLSTSLEGLVVHLDESANHAHFTLRGYTNEGLPVSKIATYTVSAELQDIAAEVMQHYCLDIERGHRKWDRIKAGADFADTIHKSVKRLHEDLPKEIAALETSLDILTAESVQLQGSIEKTQGHLSKVVAKRNKSAKQLKLARVYMKRLATKEAKLLQTTVQSAKAQIKIDAMYREAKTQGADIKQLRTDHEVDVQAHMESAAWKDAEHAADCKNLEEDRQNYLQYVSAQQVAVDARSAAVQEELEQLEAQRVAFDVASASKAAALDDRQSEIELDELITELMILNAKEREAEVERKAKASAAAGAVAEDAAKVARQQAGQAQTAEQHAQERAAKYVELAKDADAKLAEIERLQDAAQADVAKAKAEKDTAVLAKVKAEEATLAAINTEKELSAERHTQAERLKSDRAEFDAQKGELKNGIAAFKAVIAEMVAGTLKENESGKLIMSNQEAIWKAPVWMRQELRPLIYEFVQFRARLEGQLAKATKCVAKIVHFLRRDDLTVDARAEAETLCIQGQDDYLDGPDQ
ncbi:hypothetical protein [Octadecabacter antarcticus]|uniref:hypothetical protein n=1 Tax=Octadecabacter antarcticus TaxID=1217908 RepID=UPI0011819C8D|nr:hypothetical protein [Octadecabacter antarcticus]